MPLPSEQINLIVAAMLAANSFPLTKAQDLVPALRKARLLDPDYVCALGPGAVTVELASAGYDRGLLTSMFAERLQALMRVDGDGGLNEVEQAVASGDELRVKAILTRVKGIGPVIANTAWVLLKATSSRDAKSD